MNQALLCHTPDLLIILYPLPNDKKTVSPRDVIVWLHVGACVRVTTPIHAAHGWKHFKLAVS